MGAVIEAGQHEARLLSDRPKFLGGAQALQLVLRETPGGRAGITAFVAADLSTVRLHAACYPLSWDEPVARAELKRQMDDPGLASVGAKWTLRAFDGGRLDNTWISKDR